MESTRFDQLRGVSELSQPCADGSYRRSPPCAPVCVSFSHLVVAKPRQRGKWPSFRKSRLPTSTPWCCDGAEMLARGSPYTKLVAVRRTLRQWLQLRFDCDSTAHRCKKTFFLRFLFRARFFTFFNVFFYFANVFYF